MNDLIEALTIFAKYVGDSRWPTNCSHDLLCIMGVKHDTLTTEERARVEALGFHWSESDECWQSFRFGSA